MSDTDPTVQSILAEVERQVEEWRKQGKTREDALRELGAILGTEDPYAGVRQDAAVSDWEQSLRRDNG